MSLIQVESSRRIPYFVDVLLLITMYIFYCFTFTSNYCVSSHIYLYCSTEGCFGFNSATWPRFPHTISSLSAKDGEQDESQSGGERSLLHVQCIHNVCNFNGNNLTGTLCYPLVPGRVNLTNRISIMIRVIKVVKMLWTQQILTIMMTGIVVDNGIYNAKRH